MTSDAEDDAGFHIGSIPESCEIVQLGTLFENKPQNGIYKHKDSYGSGMQILHIDDFSNDGNVVLRATNRVNISRDEISKYGLHKGDIVVNRVNSLFHLENTAMVGEIEEEVFFESNMMRFSNYAPKYRPIICLDL